ncbi:LacI family transcriptional regulator [Streptomyces abyssalis]|uniref:LacI family transcriptional regulator n=1 Tax=Streptomyces abyssalis TaxID=933944 RepID=A0A1E7JVR2_9ACTN|nr:LacI family DNA-binding transcriptional regulator [Streptomyces abyssalis]OEU94533.1 LacI family transcriptional regulator [Streptomyces abyssalis]OEU95916.1 LacI family transcriptional regulator [Streptomyces abyssalis]OEV27647.1 LacI family transcriptional regulator [Streptomyces nanshensis]
MDSRGKRATLQTVADAVGVSRTTVSNAYGRPDQLNKDLRERIFEAARRLGYSGPDATARSLRRGRAGAIGLVFTETLSYAFADPYSVGFLRGVAEVAEASGTGLLLIPMPPAGGGDSETAVRNAVVDGFCLYCVPKGHPAKELIRARGLPLVTTDESDDPSIPYVGIDERASARLAGEHIARLGHRRVAVMVDHVVGPGVSGPASLDEQLASDCADLRGRLAGYRDALEEAGVDWSSVRVVAAGRNSRSASASAAAHFLDVAERPTAVLAIGDVLALGVLDACEQRGLAVGRDISVAGFDDVPEAGRARLTTVRQPMGEKGRLAGRLLLEPPEEEKVPRIKLPTELVVRATTGPAPH